MPAFCLNREGRGWDRESILQCSHIRFRGDGRISRGRNQHIRASRPRSCTRTRSPQCSSPAECAPKYLARDVPLPFLMLQRRLVQPRTAIHDHRRLSGTLSPCPSASASAPRAPARSPPPCITVPSLSPNAFCPESVLRFPRAHPRPADVCSDVWGPGMMRNGWCGGTPSGGRTRCAA